MPTKDEVGRRMKLARFRRDLTLKQVAVRSGMSATHISEIERGKTSPTIGALQRIAGALEERSAHFVEEREAPPAVVTRLDERSKIFLCDTCGRVIDMEQITGSPPWATMRVFRAEGAPGDSATRPPGLGEAVILNIRGMTRITVGDESHVLREGDTIHFVLDKGYSVETLGEDPSELIGIGSFPAPQGW